MEIKKINGDFSICKVPDLSFVHVESEYCFIGKTDEEISVVCRTEHVPQNASRAGGRLESVSDSGRAGFFADWGSFGHICNSGGAADRNFCFIDV